MTIRVANFSGGSFLGWVRCNTDHPPPHAAGRIGTDRFVLGPRTGYDTWAIDVLTHLRAGEVKELDFSAAPGESFRLDPLPANPLDHFGIPKIDGVPMTLVSLSPSGAHWEIVLRLRVGMLCYDACLLWAPGSPWMRGELEVTCSNPSMPDMTANVPSSLFTCGLSIVYGGLQYRGPIADGQRFTAPLMLVWPARLSFPVEYQTAAAVGDGAIGSNGIRKLWPRGNPGFKADALEWSRRHLQGAKSRLSGWEAGPLGVTATSGATGSQEDQVFVGGECMVPAGIGAELVRYHVALGQGRRPCHHLEATGEPLRLEAHPELRIWDGRAHWHRGVSPDQLGKPRSLIVEEANGWWGPDVEHWLFNTVAIASRITGSWSLQRELATQARVYLLQWTAAPGMSTSSPYAARAIGWEGIGVVHLWRGLADRELAAQVRARWLERLRAVLLPSFGSSVWDVRIDDGRLGPGAWWMPWQQSVGAYGLDLAGEVFAASEARAAALQAALRVVDDAWAYREGQWVSAPSRPVHGEASFDGSFNLYGMPLAPAVVLQHQPEHPVAQAIMAQLLRDSGGAHPWLPPEVLG